MPVQSLLKNYWLLIIIGGIAFYNYFKVFEIFSLVVGISILLFLIFEYFNSFSSRRNGIVGIVFIGSSIMGIYEHLRDDRDISELNILLYVAMAIIGIIFLSNKTEFLTKPNNIFRNILAILFFGAFGIFYFLEVQEHDSFDLINILILAVIAILCILLIWPDKPKQSD